MTDRRSTLRFEIVGRLRGSLATAQPVRLIDISPGGALVELASPLAVESEHPVQVHSRGQIATLDARVRHVKPAIESGGYLIGLEFVAPAQVLDEALGTASDKERV